jgi:hypothetical protein
MSILLKQKVAKQQNFAQSGHIGCRPFADFSVAISPKIVNFEVKKDLQNLIAGERERDENF